MIYIQQESFENGKICYICKEKIENKLVKDKIYCKVTREYRDAAFRDAVYSISDLKYSAPKKFL